MIYKKVEKSVSVKHAFIRCILLEKNTEKFDVIQKSIDNSNEVLQTQAWEYINTCSKAEKINKFCVAYLKGTEVTSLEENLNDDKSKFFINIKKLILEIVNKTKIKNFSLIAKHVLINTEKEQNLFRIQAFLNLNKQWTQSYLKKKTFKVHPVNECFCS